MVGLAPRRAVEQAVEFVVGLGVAVAHLGLAAQHFIEDQFGHQARDLGRCDVDRLDLLRNIALFVGQEEPEVAVAADQVLPLQPGQALLDLALQGQFVGVDAVQAQRGQVVHGRLDGIGIADEEQRTQQLDIPRLQRRVLAGLVDGALDRRIEKTLDGRVEVVQRDEGVDAFFAVADGGGLERIEHRALTARKVAAGGAHLADRLKHLLQQLKLVRRKGVVRGVVFGVLEAPEGHGVVSKRELVVDDVALGLPHRHERCLGRRRLLQQALRDHFVGVGTGQ